MEFFIKNSQNYNLGYNTGLNALSELDTKEIQLKNTDYIIGWIIGYAKKLTYGEKNFFASVVGTFTKQYNICQNKILKIHIHTPQQIHFFYKSYNRYLFLKI